MDKKAAAAAKAKATRAAQAKEFAEQTIVIDEVWQIIRSDERNWEVQQNGQFYGFYPTLVNAFKGLLAAMLGTGAKKSVADVLEHQTAIEERILAALNAR